MNQKLTDAYRLAFTMKEEGKSWAEVTGELQNRGYLNQQGRPFPESTLRKEYSTYKKDPAKGPLGTGKDPQPEPGAESSIMGEARMREIAQEVCREMIQNVRNELNEERTAPHGTTLELEGPPEPEKTGRKENRLYLKLAATVDLVLADRLMTLADEERLSVGKVLDRILWRTFGKPPLSYKLSAEELKPLEERHKAALEALKRRGKGK